jgi:predicted kinase
MAVNGPNANPMIGSSSHTPVLFILSGLPGSGKSTLAVALAREVEGAYVRIDTIEQALRDLCKIRVEGEGYRLGYRVASDNLRLGLNVVADSCNPIELTRREWERVAQDAGAAHVNIEVICSDPAEHRRRVESRLSEVRGLELPAWSEVVRREYEPWTRQRVVIDTAGRSVDESGAELRRRLREA